MHRLPIVQYKFITPNTTKMCKGKETHTYEFYHNGNFEKYLENEKEHPVNNERAYSSFNEYMSEHDTKEDNAHIKTFTNMPEEAKGMAKDTIIFSSIISLDEDVSQLGGFGEDQTKKRVCDYFFNQMMKHHHFDKNDWCYYAAEHTNTKHTHMHILIYQPNTVTGHKVMDWKIKANCMTSRWVRTNTIRFTNAVVKNLNNDLLQTLLTVTHEMKNDFKQNLKKQDVQNKIIELSREIANIKGQKGKLQYNQLVKWSKIPLDKFEKLKKDNAVSPTKAKHILAKVDSLADYVIKSDKKLADKMESITLMREDQFKIDTNDKSLNLTNQRLRWEYENELKANLGNQILNAVKEDEKLSLMVVSKQYEKEYAKTMQQLGFSKPKDCRAYKHNVFQESRFVSKKVELDMKKTIHHSYDVTYEEYGKYLRENEKAYQQTLER